MASSSSSALFQPSQISSSVSADDALQFLEDQGVFYQEDAEIGKLVDDLFTAGRQRSEDVRLHYFRPRLEQDPRLGVILKHYPIETPRFRFPWGTTRGYYTWAPKSWPTDGLIAYMLAPGSHWMCREGSLGLESDGVVVGNGTMEFSDSLLGDYPGRLVSMEKGGVLFVRTRFVHKPRTGCSIMLGLRKEAGSEEQANDDNRVNLS